MATKRARKPSAYKRTPEGNVLHAVLDLLLVKRILAFRQNTGCMPSTYKGKSRFVRFGTPGQADVLAFVIVKCPCCGWRASPTALWIECKSESGRQTPQQLSFQKIVEDDGHFYLLVNNIDVLIQWLKEKGL